MYSTDTIGAMCDFISTGVLETLGRRGAVVGVSGGLDSAVTLALAVRALGADRVRAVAMPEKDNSAESVRLAKLLATDLGVDLVIEDLTSALDALGCYRDRNEAIRSLGVEFDETQDKMSVVLVQDLVGSRMPALYRLEVERPGGEKIQRRLTTTAYNQIFAASNQKQRLRTLRLHYHAELLRYAVVGTSNFDEEYLGFFVKLGDGSWDLCPIESLLKTEVRRLAEDLGVPAEILARTTTTDTFPNDGQSQKEMFYGLEFDQLDVVLRVIRGEMSESDASSALGWSSSEMDVALHNLRRRHESTAWNRLAGLRPSL